MYVRSSTKERITLHDSVEHSSQVLPLFGW